MKTTSLTEILDELVKKKMQIEQWKLDHPEAVEIVQMVEDYLKLFDDVYRQMQPPTVIYPPLNPGLINPAPVFPPGPPWIITNTNGTAPKVGTSNLPYWADPGVTTAVQHDQKYVKA